MLLTKTRFMSASLRAREYVNTMEPLSTEDHVAFSTSEIEAG